MSPLSWIIATCLAGGVLSALAAALVASQIRREWVPQLVSFSVGALLGAAFLELLPHAFEQAPDAKVLAGTVLAGILGFFLLEKLVIWRHSHGHDVPEEGTAAAAPALALGHSQDSNHANHANNAHHAHDSSHTHHHGHSHGAHVTQADDGGRSGLLIIVGDSFHNFVDGVLIAAAFMESTALGLVAATAVIAHEIPQEVGDFLVLLHSGYTRRRALLWNCVVSLAMVVGGVVGYVALQGVTGWTNTLVALAASSMIYVAVADLIPGLHRQAELGATLMQMLLIALGVGLIAGVGSLIHGH